MELTPAQMVERYIQIRDHKKKATDEFKKSLERANMAMDKLESMLLDHLQKTGADSVACPAGTVYRNTEYSATVADREVFLTWVRVKGEWDALDVRANKTFIRELDKEGTEVPGIKLSAVYTVGVRRS